MNWCTQQLSSVDTEAVLDYIFGLYNFPKCMYY